VLVIVDHLSKYAMFIPVTGYPTSEQTIQLVEEYVVTQYGYPESILSDRGSQFIANAWHTHWKSKNVDVDLTAAYHPQSNGQAERTIQTLTSYLRCFSNYDQDNWSQLLRTAQIAFNSATHASTGLSPFEAVLGYVPRFDTTLPLLPTVDKETTNVYRKELDAFLRTQVTKAKEDFKKFADRGRLDTPEFVEGEKVWVNIGPRSTDQPKRKLGPRRLLQRIVRKVCPVSYEVDFPVHWRYHPVIHVSELEKFVEEPRFVDRPPPQPKLAKSKDGGVERKYNAILESKVEEQRTYYLVAWDADHKETSWIHASNMMDKRDVEAFHRTGNHPRIPPPVRTRESRDKEIQAKHARRQRGRVDEDFVP